MLKNRPQNRACLHPKSVIVFGNVLYCVLFKNLQDIYGTIYFQPGVPAFTVPQEAVSMKVLTERARERETSLQIVPELPTTTDGSFPGCPFKFMEFVFNPFSSLPLIFTTLCYCE